MTDSIRLAALRAFRDMALDEYNRQVTILDTLSRQPLSKDVARAYESAFDTRDKVEMAIISLSSEINAYEAKDEPEDDVAPPAGPSFAVLHA